MRQTILPILLSASLGLAACTPGEDLPPLPATTAGDYQLGAGDRLRIITYGEDQLTGDFTVNDSGNIEVPLIGSEHAGGLTVDQLQQALVAELRQRNLLTKPSVSIEISAYRPIFVLGEVNRPGPYPYQPNMNVLTAVAVAGGFTYRGVKSRAEVTRTDDGKTIVGQAPPEAMLRPGDVVTVLERTF